MPAATACTPDDSIPGHIAQTPNRNTMGKRLQSSRQKCREYPYLPIALSYRIRANSSNVASGLGFHPDSRCRGLVSKRKRGGYPMTSSPPKKNPGSALLSHGRFPQYPRHWSPSLLCSVWEQVLLLRHGHQEKSIQKKSICPFQLETEPDSWLRSERFDTTKPLGRLVRVGCRHHCLCASRLSRS